MALPLWAESQGYVGDVITDANTGERYASHEDMRNAQDWARKLAEFQAGGGVMGRVPRGTGSGGGGGLGGAYSNAMAGGMANNAANESRYGDILSGYDAMLGGGRAPAKKTATTIRGIGSTGGPVASWRNSGSQMSFSEWRALQKKLEQLAASRGGAYGSIDASGVFPRMYGGGEFLGTPPTGQQPIGGAYGQRPNVPPPVYPTYTPPVRGNQNY